MICVSAVPQCTQTAQPRGHTGKGGIMRKRDRKKEQKIDVSYLAEHALQGQLCHLLLTLFLLQPHIIIIIFIPRNTNRMAIQTSKLHKG